MDSGKIIFSSLAVLFIIVGVVMIVNAQSDSDVAVVDSSSDSLMSVNIESPLTKPIIFVKTDISESPYISDEMEQDKTEDTLTQTSNKFLFATDDLNAVFWGTYNEATHVMTGEVMFYGHPELNRVGIGTYQPIVTGTALLHLTFRDANNPLDSGLDWEGDYSNGRWTLGSNLEGRVLQAPF